MADSGELLLRATSGDGGAVNELLERHLPGLRRYVQRNMGKMVGAKESSSDVVQSVCREMLQNLEGFEYRGEAAFRQWLHRTALRKIIDRQRYYRAGKRDAGREANPPSHLSGDQIARLAMTLGTPSRDAMMREELQGLERAFERLSENDRQIIQLVYVEGASHAEAAERLGCTEVVSRKQLSRALARLSRQLVRDDEP